MRILPDQASTDWPSERLVPADWSARPAEALDEPLAAIVDRYGADTASMVAMQLEYVMESTSP